MHQHEPLFKKQDDKINTIETTYIYRDFLLGFKGGITAPPITKYIPAIYFCLQKKLV